MFDFIQDKKNFNLWGFRQDCVAGLTAAVIVLPQAVAYAAIAGLPVEYGIYTAIISPIIAALCGSSNHMLSGPTTAMSVLLYSSLHQFYEPYSLSFIEVTLFLTFCAGLVQLLLGVFRFGSFANLVSPSVLTGFTAAAAVFIIASQFKFIFADTLIQNVRILFIVIATLASALFFQHRYPKSPYFIIALVIGSLLSWMVDSNRVHLQYINQLNSDGDFWFIPSLHLLHFNFEVIQNFGQTILALALVGLLEATAISKSLAMKSGQEIDTDREFIGQGLSNFIGSFFQCYMSSGSFSRSAANYNAGAQSSLAAIMASVTLVLILWLVHDLLVYIPMPVVAAIIILIGVRLIDYKRILKIFRTSIVSTVVTSTTFIISLTINLEFGIYFGVLTSLMIFLNRNINPDMSIVSPVVVNNTRMFRDVKSYELKECPQLSFIRIDGHIFFASIESIRRQLRKLEKQSPNQKYLAILLKSSNRLEIAAADMLLDEAKRRGERGGKLFLTAKNQLYKTDFKKLEIVEHIGDKNIFENKKDLIASTVPQLDQTICADCDKRIFNECPTSQLT